MRGDTLALVVLAGLGAAMAGAFWQLGFVGLVLLGLLTWFLASRAAMNEDVPVVGVNVFRARLSEAGTPEQRAALAAERHAALSPVRLARWGGGLCLLAGLAGLAWQHWH